MDWKYPHQCHLTATICKNCPFYLIMHQKVFVGRARPNSMEREGERERERGGESLFIYGEFSSARLSR